MGITTYRYVLLRIKTGKVIPGYIPSGTVTIMVVGCEMTVTTTGEGTCRRRLVELLMELLIELLTSFTKHIVPATTAAPANIVALPMVSIAPGYRLRW